MVRHTSAFAAFRQVAKIPPHRCPHGPRRFDGFNAHKLIAQNLGVRRSDLISCATAVVSCARPI